MCGIIGIFNDKKALRKVEQALAILENRGKDGSNTLKVNQGVLGHTLHAIVGHVPGPLTYGEACATVNCEIYNWKKLNKKYKLCKKILNLKFQLYNIYKIYFHRNPIKLLP